MPKTKLDFLSRMPAVRKEFGDKLANVLIESAYKEDWDFVAQIITEMLNDQYSNTLDELYFLIPQTA